MRTLAMLLMALLLSSCALYRMPTDDSFSLIPKTNNPDYIRDRGQNALPLLAP